jgi:hypothetical protein
MWPPRCGETSRLGSRDPVADRIESASWPLIVLVVMTVGGFGIKPFAYLK